MSTVAGTPVAPPPPRPPLLPETVAAVLQRLQAAGHSACLVGGCVRDLLLGRAPHDWDVATSATPAAVQALFPRTAPTGVAFGTVTVLGKPPVEVTTYRRELPYRDARRPSGVTFATQVDEDLARRDFTVNALAWDPFAPGRLPPPLLQGRLVDPAGGLADLEAHRLRAVGHPGERFREDALRVLRAVRLATELGFDIEAATWQALREAAPLVRRLSAERVRDELLRLLAGPRPDQGLHRLREAGVLFTVLPELAPTATLPQGKPGYPFLFDHLAAVVRHLPPDPVLRLAGFLHDAGKPATARVDPGGRVTFHGHEDAGASLARSICQRLRLPAAAQDRVASLVRMHMVDGARVSRKAIRRWVTRYGEAWVRDLAALRHADHRASGYDEPSPAALRLEAELAAVLAEGSALTLRDLAVDGHDVMEVLGVPPGPAVGAALHALLDAVLADPSLNRREVLLARLRQMRRSTMRARQRPNR